MLATFKDVSEARCETAKPQMLALFPQRLSCIGASSELTRDGMNHGLLVLCARFAMPNYHASYIEAVPFKGLMMDELGKVQMCESDSNVGSTTLRLSLTAPCKQIRCLGMVDFLIYKLSGQ